MVALLGRRGKGEIMSVREMQEMGLPRSFLVKIARDMIKAGIVGAKEGRGGGYFLTRDANKVSVKSVVEALEGKVVTSDCTLGDGECSMQEVCPHKGGMKRLSKELSEVLEKYSVADLARK
jgi:Rrf2 family protein